MSRARILVLVVVCVVAAACASDGDAPSAAEDAATPPSNLPNPGDVSGKVLDAQADLSHTGTLDVSEEPSRSVCELEYPYAGDTRTDCDFVYLSVTKAYLGAPAQAAIDAYGQALGISVDTNPLGPHVSVAFGSNQVWICDPDRGKPCGADVSGGEIDADSLDSALSKALASSSVPYAPATVDCSTVQVWDPEAHKTVPRPLADVPVREGSWFDCLFTPTDAADIKGGGRGVVDVTLTDAKGTFSANVETPKDLDGPEGPVRPIDIPEIGESIDFTPRAGQVIVTRESPHGCYIWYVLAIDAPELQELRTKYDIEDKTPFHISLAQNSRATPDQCSIAKNLESENPN